MARKSLVSALATMPNGRFFNPKEMSEERAAINFVLAYLPVSTIFWQKEDHQIIVILNWRYQVTFLVKNLLGEGFLSLEKIEKYRR